MTAYVTTIRDHILEVDKSGRVVDVWDLTKILDPKRDALLGALDAGAVCVNVDLAHAGQQQNWNQIHRSATRWV
ncbi:MAG: aryl-sulfate sulfotransferase [Escherichia coli]